jgi:hypothetical protein
VGNAKGVHSPPGGPDRRLGASFEALGGVAAASLARIIASQIEEADGRAAATGRIACAARPPPCRVRPARYHSGLALSTRSGLVYYTKGNSVRNFY